jgi:hypothetical protein
MPSFDETTLSAAMAASKSYSETLRRLELCTSGGNWRTIKRYAEQWGISTAHFDPDAGRRAGGRKRARPLSEILVEGSTYHRVHLKHRLYREGLKARRCELCGQGEDWHGRRMSLIIDHVNGVRNDHRLENLRIVCPNCAATLDTHCRRNKTRVPQQRQCVRCDAAFEPRSLAQSYCSAHCGTRAPGPRGPRLSQRKVVRPPLDQLLAEVRTDGWEATGRRYGVSGTAIRKWVRDYELEREMMAAQEAPGA